MGDASTGASGAENLGKTPDGSARQPSDDDSMPPPFTEDDVTFLRYEAKYAREMHGDLIAEAFDFDDLANRIAASLTPSQYCPPLADPVKAPATGGWPARDTLPTAEPDCG